MRGVLDSNKAILKFLTWELSYISLDIPIVFKSRLIMVEKSGIYYYEYFDDLNQEHCYDLKFKYCTACLQK